MDIKGREHYELMQEFERTHGLYFGGRYDKEPKEFWAKGRIYQDGNVNYSFLVFRHGYALGKAKAYQD